MTILFVITLNFFLFRVLPGDPARAGVRDPRLTREAVEAIRVRFGLDKPVINCFQSLNPMETGDCFINPLDTQFFIYVGNLLQGELGISYHTNRPVADMLMEMLWNTLLLIGLGQILAIVLGMSLGVLAAWKARTAVDHGALLFSLTAWSLPTFWLGIILLFIGSSYWGLPIGGRLTPGTVYNTSIERWLDIGNHLILPTLTYTIVFLGEYMLIMRSTLLDVLSEDYILTAKAKGISTFQILKDHALRNAMLPMVTIIALNLGFTVTGAIQIETVFSWPGLGGAIFTAVNRRDYPMLQGAFLLIAISVIFANLAADLFYSYLDPRVEDS
ncbi:MAG: ABC transporter permease [Chloroflexi bacterium]|nr:ABC transporter permease [Ardenticatenaceae bacterium]NOG36871.1 ABC transporter permease [Chloroflexota bacterium]